MSGGIGGPLVRRAVLPPRRLPRVDIVRNDAGQWHWRFVATNGRKLCSSETYKRRIDCMTCLYTVLSVVTPLPMPLVDFAQIGREAVLMHDKADGTSVPLLTVRVLR